MIEHCAICNCQLHREQNTYARPTVKGRSHATKHHYVAELVRQRGFSEEVKANDRVPIAGRVALFHEIIASGIAALLKSETAPQTS